MSLRLGRSTCSQLPASRACEWLLTNGLGSYAMGTVAGSLERTYHGLLIEAQEPPLGRTLRLAKLDPFVRLRGGAYALDANIWRDGFASPDGARWLESFALEDLEAVWTFLVGGRRLERRMFMVPGRNTTVVAWRLLDDGAPLWLELRALGALRSHHHTSDDGGPEVEIELHDRGLDVHHFSARTLRLRAEHGWESGTSGLYRDFFLSKESDRGLDAFSSLRHLGNVVLGLRPGHWAGVRASTEEEPIVSIEEALEASRDYARSLRQARARVRPTAQDDERIDRLVLAADQFVVGRTVKDESGKDVTGKTIIAGYPWFGDWGRDTMIALPGVALSTGRAEVAAQILKTFARLVDRGMLPNRFPGAGEPPEYNTVDATLWYFRAIEQTMAALPSSDAEELAKVLVPVLNDIVRHHLEGTRYNIKVDEDGLLQAGEEGVQLTWMDARVDKHVITPRYGKPVEINGLWIHALTVLIHLRTQLGHDTDDLVKPLAKARASFARFWNPETSCLFDVLDTPEGKDDPSIRPNQLLALSLPSCPLDLSHKQDAVRVCTEELLTSYGLRSLCTSHEDYEGVYGGPASRRDGMYHQGVTWGWLIGPWVRASLEAGEDPAQLRTALRPLLDHLGEALLGSISEIFDGDEPFWAHGAPAQAWSVAEVLAVWDLISADA